MRAAAAVLAALLALPALAGAAAPRPARIVVKFDPVLGAPHGRLLVFLARGTVRGDVEPSDDDPRAVEVLGTEVDAEPGAAVELPLDADAFPASLAGLAPGRYTARAELDLQHRYPYDGGQAGDPVSASVPVELAPGRTATLFVGGRRRQPGENPPHPWPSEMPPGSRLETFVSPSLSAFFGRPTEMRAYVVPPPDYAASGRRYATVYAVAGFGADEHYVARQAAERGVFARDHPSRLIYVYLDPRVPLGHCAFADSANNGPWGTALARELIPYLESRWRMAATERTRFLTGHSSGGWATLWLQIAYPRTFGGTWSTSPDPVDFHDFTGPDLVDRPDGNMYVDAGGAPYQLVRVKGRDVLSLREYALLDRALGPYGGQTFSFDAVFSPRGDDGRPQPLFDRTTGQIDPAVARAWEKYDLARILRDRWPELGPQLRGKLHVVVGGEDTFHLERGVIRLRDELAALGSDAQIEIVPGRGHFDLDPSPDGRPENNLLVRFEREMTAAARAAGF